MDSLSRSLHQKQEITSEPKKAADRVDSVLRINEHEHRRHHYHHSNYPRQLLAPCHHHSLTTVRLTCEGDLHEPNFPQKLKKLTSKIKILVSNDKKPLKVTKVEPWNSVRVTFNLPNEAAQRLRQLAEHGDANLRQLGILSIQLEGQQVISLRLSNPSSANSGNSLTCNNIDQVSSSSSSSSSATTNRSSSSNSNDPSNISLVSADTVREPTPIGTTTNNKYPYGQINGALGDESSNGSSSNSCLEPPPHVSSADPQPSTLPPKLHPFHQLGSGQENASCAQSLPPSAPAPPPLPPSTSTPSSTIALPASSVAPSQQPQKVLFSQTTATTTTNRAGNSLLLSAHSQPTTTPNQIEPTGPPPQIKPASLQSAINTSSNVSKTEEPNGSALSKISPESLPSAAAQMTVQSAPFSSAASEANAVVSFTSTVPSPFAISTPAAAFSTTTIRNSNTATQLNGPRPHHHPITSTASSPSQQSPITSQKSVPQASSLLQSLQPSMSPVQQQQDDPAPSSLSPAVEPPPPPAAAIKSHQPPFDHNANYVNSASSASTNTTPLYQSLSTSAPSQQSQHQTTTLTSAAVDKTTTTTPPLQPQSAVSSQTATTAAVSSGSSQPPKSSAPSTTTSDILGSSVDAVDDEDLLASVAATGPPIDFNNLTGLDDLNLFNMLEEMATVNQNQSDGSASVASSVNSSSGSSNSAVHRQSNTSRSESSSQPSERSSPAAPTNVANASSVSAKLEPFRSPNVVAPQSTQSMPFFIAQHQQQQQQQQQQATTKVGPTVVSAGGQPVLINSSTGAVLSVASQHLSMIASTSTTATAMATVSTMYPFTSMQHASLFTSKHQPSNPRHVIVPVRQSPAVRAAASQQVPLQQQPQQQQSVPMIRALQPTVTTPSDLLVQPAGPQQVLFRPVSGQLVRQQLPPSTNVSSALPGKPQQQQQQQSQPQQIVIRQGVPFAGAQQVASTSGQQQQNTVALSSPLLVNLLQSDVQSSSTSVPQVVQQQQQQQTAFMAQTGSGPQIRLLTPGSHTDGTSVMMMVRVSSAPQGTTTQLINASAIGSIVASMPSSQQVVTSIPSTMVEQQQQQQSQQQISVTMPGQTNQQMESSASASVLGPKPKKPRKSRAKKHLAESAKTDGPTQTSMSVTTIPISTGAITSIPLSLATTNTSRIPTSSSASTILTFTGASSIGQILKLQSSPGKPQQQAIISTQAGQHLFNQKQRVQPVVIASSNGSLLSSVSTPTEANVAVSSAIASSASTFIITNMPASCFSGGTSATSTATTSTAGVQLPGNRKQIFLPSRSNSFPVSSARSASERTGSLLNRSFGSGSSASSTPSLNVSPVKLISPSATSQVPICIAASSPSSSSSSSSSSFTSTLESNLTSTQSPGKSSLGHLVSVSAHSENSATSKSHANSPAVQTVAPISTLSSTVTPIVTSVVGSNFPTASVTLVNPPVAIKTPPASSTASQSTELQTPIAVSQQQQQQATIVASKSTKQIAPIAGPGESQMSKVTQVTVCTATSIHANSSLLTKLSQLHQSSNTTSILASSPKQVQPPTSSFAVQLPNKTELMKVIALPAVSPLPPSAPQQPVLPVEANLKVISTLPSPLNVIGISSESPFIGRSVESVVNLLSTEPKMVDSLFAANVEPKKLTNPLSDKSFKLSSLEDVFETEGTSSSKLDLFAEDDTDLSAPISPSYFLAPPSAFENKAPESQRLEVESNNVPSTDASSSKTDLSSSSLSASSQKEEIHASSSAADLAPPKSTTETSTSLATVSTLSSSTTSTASSSSEAVKPESTTTTTKATESQQSKSNSYDSLSYFLANKHKYSQDLPDHILEDDEDGDDSDGDMDFGLGIFPKTSRFLSGSIGSIGGTSNLCLPSTSSPSLSLSLPCTTLIDKTSDALSDVTTTTSAMSFASLETATSPGHTDQSTLGITTSESKPVPSQELGSILASDEVASDFAIDSEADIKLNPIETQSTLDMLDHLPLKEEKEHSKPEQSPMHIFHSIMNGDVSPSRLKSDTSDYHNSSGSEETHDFSSLTNFSASISTEESKIETSSTDNIKPFQLATVVASKSYPTMTSTVANCSTASIVSSKLDSTSVSIATVENHEQPNAAAESNCKSVKLESPAAGKVSRKTISATPTGGVNKKRKAPAISATSTTRTVSSAEPVQSTASVHNKSELHSLLASPSATAKPIAISSMATTDFEAGSAVPSDTPNPTASTEVSNSRQMFITFKPPSQQQQTIPSSSSQPQPSKAVQLEGSSSISSIPTTSTPPTFVKVLVPGVNIAGSTASKLLTMAASNASSIVTSNSSGSSASLVSAVASSPGQNAPETSGSGGNKSQSIQQMIGARYILTGHGGQQFPQFVVVKSAVNNASAANNPQQVKLISTPSKLTAVSGTSTSQPFIMVSGAAGQTLLSVKPSIQTISSHETLATTSSSISCIANEQQQQQQQHQSSESDTESSRAITRKTSASSASQSDTQQVSDSDTVLSSSPSPRLENSTKTTESKSILEESGRDRRTPVASSSATEATCNAESTFGNTAKDGCLLSDSLQVNALVDLPKGSNAFNRQNTRFKAAITKLEPNAVVHIANNHATLVTKSVVKINSDSSVTISTVGGNSASGGTVLTNSMVIGKEKGETVTVLSSPRTVYSTSSADSSLISGNTTATSNSNVVILRTDPSMDKDGHFGLKKRQIVITKPVTMHSSSDNGPQQTEAQAVSVFATKTTNASATTVATKTIPTILRQRKRKSDAAFITNSSDSANLPKLSRQGFNSDHSESDFDSSQVVAGGSSMMMAPAKTVNKTKYRAVQPNETTTTLPIIDFVDESNDDNSDVAQTVMPKPRKRARKSNVTTAKQQQQLQQQPQQQHQPGVPTMGTSLLLTEFNQIHPNDVNNHHAQMNEDIKAAAMAATSSSVRVLRNTASSKSVSIAANTTNKRAPRGRNALTHSVSVPVVAAVTVPAPSGPAVSATFANADATTLVAANSVTKTRKPRESTASANSARQTRSNRTRNSRTAAANEHSAGANSNNEVAISDNAVDESPCMSPEIEVISMSMDNPHITLSALNADISIASQAVVGQVNSFAGPITSPQAIDQRVTIMEGSNSNSSTASSSSSNSLLVKRSRGKPMPSPVTTKPSLRSNSASETLASPMNTTAKRRRVAKEINR